MKSSFKKSLLISLLASTLETSFPIFPTYAMDGLPQEERAGKGVPRKQPKIIEFLTLDDAINYSHTLRKLTLKGHFDYVLETEDNILILPEGAYSVQDFDQYIAPLHYVFSITHNHFGKSCASKFQKDKAKEHFMKAEQYSRTYLQHPVCGEHFVSQHQSVNKVLNVSRCIAHDAAGKTNYAHAGFLIKTKMPDDQIQEVARLYCQAIKDWEKSIYYAEKCGVASTEQKEGLLSSLLHYRHLCQAKDRQRIDQKIKKYKHEWRRDVNCAPFLRVLEEQRQFQALNEKPVQQSQKIQTLQNKNIDQQILRLTQTVQSVQEEINHSSAVPLKYKIIIKDQELICRIRVSPDDLTLVPLLHEIEEEIQRGLSNAGLSSALLDVYQQYEELLGGDLLRIQMFCHILPLLLKTGDVEEAWERALILKKLEEQKFGKSSFFVRYVCASLSNMLGNLEELHAIAQEMEGSPETLESLAQEWEVIKSHQKENKAAAKAQQEKWITSQIKQQQEAVAALEATSETNKDEQKPRKALPRNSDDSPTEPDFGEPSSPSPAAEKAAKQKRHQEAEAQRALAKIQSPLPVEAKKEEPKTSQSIEERVAALSSEELLDLLGDFYDFTGTAKKVCDAIKEGSWQITRDEMILFFCQGGIGCTLKESKHKKISLPKTISYEGQPVLILGGALTFPRWDGPQSNETPDNYLRQQMLNALKRILVLHLKAQEGSGK
jgi:hypothetical protein